jgi:hypothetical protein
MSKSLAEMPKAAFCGFSNFRLFGQTYPAPKIKSAKGFPALNLAVFFGLENVWRKSLAMAWHGALNGVARALLISQAPLYGAGRIRAARARGLAWRGFMAAAGIIKSRAATADDWRKRLPSLSG